MFSCAGASTPLIGRNCIEAQEDAAEFLDVMARRCDRFEAEVVVRHCDRLEAAEVAETLEVMARRCDTLEACLGAVRLQRSARCEAIRRVVADSVHLSEARSVRSSPQSPSIDIAVYERVDMANKLEVQVTDRTLELPRVEPISRVVEVPKVHFVEKVIEVPRVQVQEVVRHVPKIHVQEIVRTVPKIEVQVVEKRVDVPHVQYVDKIVEVPQHIVREAAHIDNSTIKISTWLTEREVGTFEYKPDFVADFEAIYSPRRELVTSCMCACSM